MNTRPRLRFISSLILCLLVLSACKTVRQELKPVRETTLVTARAGRDVTLSWLASRGEYYSIMYTDKALQSDNRGRWEFLPGAINLTGMSGENVIVYDVVPDGVDRFYRLKVDTAPITPSISTGNTKRYR